MIPQWAVTEISDLVTRYGNWKTVRKNMASVIERLGWEPSQEEVYQALTGESPIAPCGREKKFVGLAGGYKFCGPLKVCSCAMTAMEAKRDATMIARYGVRYTKENPDLRDKARSTMVERYGTEHALQNSDLRDRARSTTRERHGVDYAAQNPLIMDKVRATNLTLHGNEVAAKSETVRKKIGDQTRAHAKQSAIKAKETNVDRYGVGNPSQRHISAQSLLVLNDPVALSQMTQSIPDMARDLGVSPTTVARYWHRHGIPIPQSSYERHIGDFLNGLGVDYIANTRRMIGGKELDFFLPERRIAIEFNGLYWHSEARVGKSYHREKYEACRDRGIRLLMINEDEWTPAYQSRITNILGLSHRGDGARKLMLGNVDAMTANAFYQKWHIQGRTAAIQYSVGAYDSSGELVAAMSFNRQRGTRAIELIRFCTNGKSYAGVFTRLLKRAVLENSYDEIISFADLRHSTGGVYSNNGFELVGEIPPDYQYCYRNRTIHKSLFTKSKIATRFGIDMSSHTERTAMEELDIPRIYDCGKLKFVWSK